MPDTPETPSLLPTYSHEKLLEDESLDELKPLLRGLFLIRDERAQDYGVDLSIEVVLEDRATNYRAMVQVKARSALKPNADGSFSLSVESSNIEYLLSAASSIVVLYDAERKAFYWCDVLAAALSLQAAGTNYRDQGSITLRFTKRLSRETAAQLQEDVLGPLRAARKLRSQIGGLDPDGLVHVNAAGVGTTTGDAAEDFFSRGWKLAGRGHLQEVQRLFGLLSPATQNTARARLLMAHAHASNGQAIAAWAHANEARRNIGGLSSDDRDLLDLIDIGVDHALAREEPAELAAREDAVRLRASPQLRIQLDVAALRHEVTLSGDPECFSKFGARATALVAEMTKSVGASHPATLSARVLESEVWGSDLAYQYARLLMTCGYGDGAIGLAMRRGATVQQAVTQANVAYADWVRVNAEAHRSCAKWPLLALELERTALQADLVLLRHTRLIGITEGFDTPLALDRPTGSELLDRIRDTRERANALKVDEVEVKVRLLQVQLFDLADRRADERSEAQALAAFCRTCGYARIEQEARRHEAGTSAFREQRAEMMAAQQVASGAELVHASPAQRAEFAEGIRSFLGLPPDRIPNILDDVDCNVFELEIRQTFCRHLDVEQYRLLSQDPATIYARPALRRCTCQQRALTTMFPSRKWRALVVEFQRSYCTGCDLRSPLGTNA
jgi:hypothetical protein